METKLKDYFDCPHCGIKNVKYSHVANCGEQYEVYDNGNFIERKHIKHLLIQCNREECERITYYQILTRLDIPGTGSNPDEVIIKYPADKFDLPEYIPQKMRDYYKEAKSAYNFGLLNSASAMCRRTIYEICDKQKVQGKDYKEKIKNLGLDKRITDPLLNIKSIGDDSLHAGVWDKKTIETAIDILGIIIDMIYTQENRIKDFTKHYSKRVQNKKK